MHADEPTHPSTNFEHVAITATSSQMSRELEMFLLSAGMAIDWRPQTPPFSVHATRSSTFVAAVVNTGFTAVRWPRVHTRARRRVLFVFAKSGTGSIQVGAEHQAIPAGSAIVVSPGAEAVEIIGPGKRQTFLFFSVDVRALGVPFLTTERSIRVLREPAVTSMAYGAWHGLAHASRPTTLHAETIAQAQAVSVARALLSQWRGPDESGGDLYARAKHYIRVHATDPELDPTGVAEVLGVAPRTLQVAFKKHDTTINRELRLKRFENVQLLLEGRPSIPRLELARQAGFRSLKQLRDATRDFSPRFAEPADDPTRANVPSHSSDGASG